MSWTPNDVFEGMAKHFEYVARLEVQLQEAVRLLKEPWTDRDRLEWSGRVSAFLARIDKPKEKEAP